MSAELISVLPFVIFILSMAVVPLINLGWWEKNYYYFSFIPAVITILFYFFVINNSEKIFHSFFEYISFISLIFSLYVVAGGIFLKIKGKSTPLKNVLFLLIGSLLANFIGTIGASIILIRPFINSNKYHLKPYHIIFFIFSVCNIAGCLTPLGNPPLFIGFLKGVPFFWMLNNIFIVWVICILYLLVVFYAIDKLNYNKIGKSIREQIEVKGEEFKISGISNIILFLVIIFSVFLKEPVFLRDVIMLLCAVLSYKFTPKEIHSRNGFSFAPIREVAILFFAIFITMVPVVSYLSDKHTELGNISTSLIYWLTGAMTSILDNAPAYLNSLTFSMSVSGFSVNNPVEVAEFINLNSVLFGAVTVSSVFFGAMTYLGNGPNFIIRAIAENKGLKMPGFLRYIYAYSVPVLIPIFVLVWLLFF
jgi:Na+/H+ antiporter NhaD/arsenite permease-like protein